MQFSCTGTCAARMLCGASCVFSVASQSPTKSIDYSEHFADIPIQHVFLITQAYTMFETCTRTTRDNILGKSYCDRIGFALRLLCERHASRPLSLLMHEQELVERDR
jgi:hypothetical protein